MPIYRLYRKQGEQHESCFYIDTNRTLKPEELGALQWLVGETFEQQLTSEAPYLSGPIVEIGPRLAMETPFSSNAVAIARAIGLSDVTRIERSRRYQLGPSDDYLTYGRANLDKMTEEVYVNDIERIHSAKQPDPVIWLPLLEGGLDALKHFSDATGQAMDQWDLEYYYDLFAKQLRRNPSNVEIADLGGANSEHSRHWFFKGIHVIDGVTMSETLFEIIRAPLQALHDGHSVLAFNDNVGAMRGHEVRTFAPRCPWQPTEFVTRLRIRHITATAESHNHPSMWEPFQGAATGGGGRMRDSAAGGRGSLLGIGMAGYCVGNLYLPGYPIPGEDPAWEIATPYASARTILIRASDGASSYGNEVGEPLICGFTRTFGMQVGEEWLEFRKPVMYSGGIGHIDEEHVKKHEPTEGMVVVRIGGPAYRVGVGGGSASSLMQGDNAEELDFNSVQRANAEMGNKPIRVIRTCVELASENPIESIHDQGAVGPSNVLKELVAPAGAVLHLGKIVLGDATMSVLEIWTGEYQEGYGLLIRPEKLALFQAICDREQVNCEVLGTITGDGRIVVVDDSDGSTPVDLPLDKVLTNLPQKTFRSERIERKLTPLEIPAGLTIERAIEQVFRLPQVCSKGFLVHKVDRSVTGLVARQQCCGPLQLPVADCCAVADGYFGFTGAAGAIGEQPVKMLINPAAGARMAIGEMLTNLVSAKISALGQVRCRANWMWPAKLAGEAPRIYDAAVAVRDLMRVLGIGVDGGKDSSSMAAIVRRMRVKSPGQLVILGYAPVPDVRRILTPDIKQPGESLLGLIDLGRGKNRLGGSSLAQALGQIGGDTPDVDDPMLLKGLFLAVQTMIERGLILSIHDRSDGGLITTVAEMAMAGNCGAFVEVWRGAALPSLFSEELGIVVEYMEKDQHALRKICAANGVPFACIGGTLEDQTFDVVTRGSAPGFVARTCDLRQQWEATSLRLEEEQTNQTQVEQERAACARTTKPTHELTFRPRLLWRRPGRRPEVAIVREEGSNGDREMAAACYAGGLAPADVAMSDLLDGRAVLDAFQGVLFPGGFSYMDVFDSAKGWAGKIRFNPTLRAMFERFYQRPDTFSFGVCNGCQLMALLGWVPGQGLSDVRQPRFVRNLSGRFESRWSQVKILPSPSILFRGMEGSILGVWNDHGEGRLVFPNEQIREHCKVPLVYVDHYGEATESYPDNPNGSGGGFAGLCSDDGQHTAIMSHPERLFRLWQWPYVPSQFSRLRASPWLRLFQNARDWCLEQR